MTATDNAPTGGLRALLDRLWRLHTRDECGVLGVVIATEGSTYQKPGALVLLDKNGLCHGVISGGCLEPELERIALDVLIQQRAAVAEFDTRADDDLIFGSGTGCHGRVALLLLPLPPQAPLARALFAALDQGAALEIDVVTDGIDTGVGRARMLTATNDVQSPFFWDSAGRNAQSALVQTKRVRIAAPARLLLFGAGPETAPLAAFVQSLGWFVTVVEHRERWSAFAQGAPVDRRIGLAPTAAHAALHEDDADAVVVMSHNFALDLAHLTFCARGSTHYVGLLGPAARRDALLNELASIDREALLPRLHAPVGLNLGGEGPEAIALSIVAELQQYFSAQHRLRDAGAHPE